MNDPTTDITTAIDRCAAASTPDAQREAFHHYFTHDATFTHPLCHVPSASNSRETIIRIYALYRALIPRTSFEILSIAWDEKARVLVVRLVQRPEIQGLRLICVPELPMLVSFRLRREEAMEGDGVEGQDQGKWLVESQEDYVHIRDALMAVPAFRWVGYSLYHFFLLMGLLTGYILTSLGFWTSSASKKSTKAS